MPTLRNAGKRCAAAAAWPCAKSRASVHLARCCAPRAATRRCRRSRLRQACTATNLPRRGRCSRSLKKGGSTRNTRIASGHAATQPDYAGGTRESADGVDVNRSFGRGGQSPEARAILTANRDRKFVLSIDLHEDCDADGFYCYEYGGGDIGRSVRGSRAAIRISGSRSRGVRSRRTVRAHRTRRRRSARGIVAARSTHWAGYRTACPSCGMPRSAH